jgi:uncharacterized protein YeaO (DUF488 family)
MIKLKRAYEASSDNDGERLLVERLWPRGLKKTDAHIDGWLKDVAPSPELRVWFGHDPEKWSTFCRRYFSELDSKPEVWEPIIRAAKHRRVTLIFSSHDADHNNAVALKRYLQNKLKNQSSTHPSRTSERKVA